MKVTIHVDLSHVTRSLAKIEDGLKRVDEFLDEVGEAAQREFGRIFDTGGLGQWPDLQKKTKQRKKQLGVEGDGILVRTGAMRESFTRKGSKYNVFKRSGNTLDVGSKIPYAHFHQQGTAFHPVRPIVFMTPNLRAEIDEISFRYLSEIANG